jgi:hypothetical protein
LTRRIKKKDKMEKLIESNAMIKNRWLDTLYTAGVIAAKDITEALKNPRVFVNIILALGLMVFFHFMLTLRPFDKDIEVLVVGANSPDQFEGTHELADGYKVMLDSVDSQKQMARNLGYRDLGLVIPPDIPAGYRRHLGTGRAADLNRIHQLVAALEGQRAGSTVLPAVQRATRSAGQHCHWR